MGGSRRRLKKSKPKVQVGLPKKNPNVFKPAFNLPPKLRTLIDPLNTKWDDKASVITNYKSFGFVSNPNLLGVRSRTPRVIESESLQVPPPKDVKHSDVNQDDGDGIEDEEVIDSGSDLEEDDLKSALGKKRRDGKSAPPQPLTTIQRVHISRLVEKYGDNYEGMFRDRKLNSMQHTVATLEKLCKRYHMYKNKNAMILSR